MAPGTDQRRTERRAMGAVAQEAVRGCQHMPMEGPPIKIIHHRSGNQGSKWCMG